MSAADLTDDFDRLVGSMTEEELQEEVDAATADLTDEEQLSTDSEQADAEHEEEGAPSEDRTGDPLAKVRREAAGYRVKLRETEGERDRLAGVVESMQRAEAERLVTDVVEAGYRHLAVGSDLWRGGVELSELLDEDGQLDRTKLKAAGARVGTEHPHWRAPAPDFSGGVRATAPRATDPASSLSDRLRRAGAP
jgi:hypothetical protein